MLESGQITYTFPGKLDDIRIYTRALSESEVRDLSGFSTAFFDHFDDAKFADKWDVVFDDGTSEITESGSELNIKVQKPSVDCDTVRLDTIDTFSGHDIVLEGRIKQVGYGGADIRLVKDDENWVLLRLSTNDTNCVQFFSKENGLVTKQQCIESSSPYLGQYNDFKIIKNGDQYNAYINGEKKGTTFNNLGIGDTNLVMELSCHTCEWKSGNADNYFDYAAVNFSSLSPVEIDIEPVNRDPESPLVTLPEDGQLIDLTENGLDIGKPTIVISHGWNPNFPLVHTEPGDTPDWITMMANAMIDQEVDNNFNIVWWDWLKQATSTTSASWGKAASNAPSQGDALAEALYSTLGPGYSKKLHFIGHSMGARVNRTAVNTLHSGGWDPNNTHVTILDAAEFGDLDYNPWDKSIPDQAVWIDNYVTAFGDIHTQAANLILRQGMPIFFSPGLISIIESLYSFHAYSHQWYIESIKYPLVSDMGFKWSFEGEGLNGSPGVGSTFVQTHNTLDDQLEVDGISWSEAESIIIGRNILLSSQYGLLTLSMMGGPIQAVGNVTADAISVVKDKLIKWTIRLTLEEASPAYAWLPIEIPLDSEFLSFDFTAVDPGDGDFLTVGIDGEPVYTIELEHVDAGTTENSGLIGVSAYAGSEVELFIGLNSVGSANSKVIIEDISFHNWIPGDYDRDGDVDGSDLKTFIGLYNQSSLDADLNKDGSINSEDISKISFKIGYIGG